MSRKNKPRKSKTAFVLSHPVDTPAKTIVAAGKTKGIALTEAYIYGIRSRAKKAKTGKTPLITPRSDRGTSVGGRSEVEQFAALALRLGLTKAGDVLEKLRALAS